MERKYQESYAKHRKKLDNKAKSMGRGAVAVDLCREIMGLLDEGTEIHPERAIHFKLREWQKEYSL